ncbi:MAG: PAS domain-containing protein [Acidobacteria bacterium]|nr:PAS domain-containing protein [Acidobacteriota bacterium]
MQFRELRQLVDSTSDATFAVDGSGTIVAWNAAAEDLFGLPAQKAIGTPCGDILHGSDECGEVCSPDCSIQQAARHHQKIRNFDLEVQTRSGKQWCNVSVLVADLANVVTPYLIHVVRAIDTRKRLEMLMRDFVVSETKLPLEEAQRIKAINRSPSRQVALSERELEILRLLAKGATTKTIAEQLHISRTTVNNHVQHILPKLNAHTRLEAIRRAEHAGLI